MAQVNVDLSEYDMLREAKSKAEKEVTELKAEIEEYKKNARVIVTTKKCYRVWNADEIAKTAIEYFRRSNAIYAASEQCYTIPFHTCTTFEEREKEREERKFKFLKNAISTAITLNTSDNNLVPIDGSYRTNTVSTTEIRGFEDVRLKVEEALNAEYKEELENKLEQAKISKEEYKTKYNKVEEEVKLKYDEELELTKTNLKNEYKEREKLWKSVEETNKNLQKEKEQKESTIKDLQDEIEVLKTDNRKVENYRAAAHHFEVLNKELETKIKNLQDQLQSAELKLSNDIPWYKRIFK